MPVGRDRRTDPDLFWALRDAGGGHFGVVTSFGFKTVPADTLTCFKLVWPQTHAAALIESWHEWAALSADLASAAVEEMSHGAATRYLAEQAPGAEVNEQTSSAEPSEPELAFGRATTREQAPGSPPSGHGRTLGASFGSPPMRMSSSGTQSAAMRTSGRAQLEEGMTQLADGEAMEEFHHRESNWIAVSFLWEPPRQDAAASVGQLGVTR